MSSTAESTLQTAGPTVETWTLDPAHSLAEFAVKHLMISTVKGRFGDMTGTLHLDPARPTDSRVEVDLDVSSVTTSDEKRDTHLKSADFFDVGKYPSMKFRTTGVEGDINGRFKLIGDLTIRDTTRRVVLDANAEGRVKDPWGGERMGFTASGRINRTEFNLTWNVALEAGGVLVGDDVRLSIEAEFLKQNN